MLRRIAVFAGTKPVSTADELAAVERVSRTLPERSITMVVTGEHRGSGGALIDRVREAGGRLVGVEVAPPGTDLPDQPGFTERRRVDDEFEQRRQMLALADAVLALPGAFDALEPVIALWSAAASDDLPIGLLDEGGYYTRLMQTAGDETLDHFVRESQRGRLVLSRSLDDLLNRLGDFRPPETRRTLGSGPDDA